VAVLPVSRVPTWPTSAKVGSGGSDGAAILEQHDGTAWTVVGRYGSLRDANVVVDDAVGAGADPGSMRVVETHTSATTSRALMVVGCIALGVAIAIIMLYVLLG
jgi:preprotein translocase subunit SecF